MEKSVKEFGKKVKKIRESKKMSQGDVAKILDVHRTYISSIERGQRNPSLITIGKFAKALGVKTSELIEK
jgi:transcriptional regulator with XRE-family HTH domain